jgi:uncharacterized protein YrrD
MQRQLKSAKEILGYELGAQDGKIGKCHDFLFDDRDWVIRYIIADTRKWLPGRKVLISPISIGTADRTTHTLQVNLTRDQIKEAPPLDTDAPVSRHYENLFNQYYQWAHYWDGGLIWGPHSSPSLLQRPPELGEPTELGNIDELPAEKTHLRSIEEVIGYQIQATDNDIGHVEDFIVEDETWMVRYLVVDTSNWLPGSKRVIVPPGWVDMVDWGRSAIVVKISSEQIEDSPEYDHSVPIDRDYEKKVFDFYGLPYYW